MEMGRGVDKGKAFLLYLKWLNQKQPQEEGHEGKPLP
jgi:hypothetical protein